MCFKVDPSGMTLDEMLRQLEAPLGALADLAGRSRRYEPLTRA